MAELTGLAVQLVLLDSSARIIRTADDGIWDLFFAPVDAARRERADFGAARRGKPA